MVCKLTGGRQHRAMIKDYRLDRGQLAPVYIPLNHSSKTVASAISPPAGNSCSLQRQESNWHKVWPQRTQRALPSSRTEKKLKARDEGEAMVQGSLLKSSCVRWECNQGLNSTQTCFKMTDIHLHCLPVNKSSNSTKRFSISQYFSALHHSS